MEKQNSCGRPQHSSDKSMSCTFKLVKTIIQDVHTVYQHPDTYTDIANEGI